MSDSLREFKAEFKDTITDCERYCYATRAKELQIEAIKRLEIVKGKAYALKIEMIAQSDNDSANQLLSLEEIIQGLIHELKMWVAIKGHDYDTAWSELVDAQGALRTAMQAHSIASHLLPHIEGLYSIEHLLFPPQTFFSPSMIIKKSTCSICDHEYGTCEHVVCKSYMGKMCTRRFDEAEIASISIVDNPANKHCRVKAITEGNSTRDFLTWRIMPEKKPEAKMGRSIFCKGIRLAKKLIGIFSSPRTSG